MGRDVCERGAEEVGVRLDALYSETKTMCVVLLKAGWCMGVWVYGVVNGSNTMCMRMLLLVAGDKTMCELSTTLVDGCWI